MARVDHAAQQGLGAYPTLPIAANGADLVEVAADATNKESTDIINGKTFVIAHNTGVGARTVTFTSVVDAQNRTGDITAYSIGAGEIAIFGPFHKNGWGQSGGDAGKLFFEASHAEVLFSVLNATAP